MKRRKRTHRHATDYDVMRAGLKITHSFRALLPFDLNSPFEMVSFRTNAVFFHFQMNRELHFATKLK